MSIRVAIVHYAEHVPFEEGYKPVRYGRLAEYLTQQGIEVVRICPSFAFAFQYQRPMEWSGKSSSEGITQIVATRSFSRSRSLRRFGFLKDLCREAACYFKADSEFDLIIVGYPPPGMIRAVRRVVGPDIPIVADIRDLWPDALVPNGRIGGLLKPAFEFVGRLLAYEINLASGVIALSPTLLHRAPEEKRLGVIPISMTGTTQDLSHMWPSRDEEFVFVFIGSFAPLFDFKSLIEGWSIFCQDNPRVMSSRLRIYGTGQRKDEVAVLAKGIPGLTLEGWIESNKVGECLATSDVGISPPRYGQGITLGNKVLEYLDAGLFVLNSLDMENAQVLTDKNLGRRVECNAMSWAKGFSDALENSEQIRAKREHRQKKAREVFGSTSSENLWRGVIETTTGYPLCTR